MSFPITRADGRSNTQVILDQVKDKPAGTAFSYEEFAAALGAGDTRAYSAAEVCRIVTAAQARLLKEQARTLHNIRRFGYRIAPAAYHIVLASDRKHRADRQLLRGLRTLEHVRWDELDANQRMAHEGQLLITGALVQQMQALERRQAAIEKAIRNLAHLEDGGKEK